MMYPDIEIEMHASYELVDLAVDEIDVAIRYGDGNWGDLFCHRLLTDQLFPVRSPAYLQAKGLSAPHDLSRAVLLRYCREPWLPWFQAAGLIWPEPQTGPIFNDLGLVLEAALLSYGVALARSTIVEKSMAAGRLQKLFDVITPSRYAYYFVCPSSQIRRHETASFFEWIRSAALGESQDVANPSWSRRQ